MKSTDIDRIDREMRQFRKKQELQQKRIESRGINVGDYIKRLHSLFYHDQKKIYNIKNNLEILKLFEEMKKNIPDNQWEIVLHKAVRETKIEQREAAFNDLKALLSL